VSRRRKIRPEEQQRRARRNAEELAKGAEERRKRYAEQRAKWEAAAEAGIAIRPTYCPVCYCNTGELAVPPHKDKRGRQCDGAGKYGVYPSQIEAVKRSKEVAKPRDEPSTSVRAVRGGLPGLGKQHR
jgi:hypothetical protein